MNKNWYLLLLFLGALASGGCSMCCGTHDLDYPTYGGRHTRSDRQWGRVGSIFSDPIYTTDAPFDTGIESPPESIIPPETRQNGDPSEDILPEPKPEGPEPPSYETPAPDESNTSSAGWRRHPLRR